MMPVHLSMQDDVSILALMLTLTIASIVMKRPESLGEMAEVMM